MVQKHIGRPPFERSGVNPETLRRAILGTGHSIRRFADLIGKSHHVVSNWTRAGARWHRPPTPAEARVVAAHLSRMWGRKITVADLSRDDLFPGRGGS